MGLQLCANNQVSLALTIFFQFICIGFDHAHQADGSEMSIQSALGMFMARKDYVVRIFRTDLVSAAFLRQRASRRGTRAPGAAQLAAAATAAAAAGRWS